MATSSPSPQNESLVKLAKLLKLALQAKDIHLIQFNQRQEALNLLLHISDDIDPAQIAPIIWTMDAQLKTCKISLVNLYRKVEEQVNPNLFMSIDLTQLPVSAGNPFSDSIGGGTENLTKKAGGLTTNISSSNSMINPNLGLKERAKLGDLQAIKQILDLALIHINATTVVRLEGKILTVIVESAKVPDQQTIVLSIKRQLDLLNSSIFNTTKIKGKKEKEDVAWTEEIHLKTLAIKARSSDKLAKNSLISKAEKVIENLSISKSFIIVGGVAAVGIAAFLGTRTSVPDVTGQQVNYAEGILKGRGLETIVVEQIEETIAPGQVITQDPRPRSFFPRGESVQLTIAKAPSYTITGSITLIDSDIGGSRQNCYGTGGYDDMHGNMPVTIKDGSGQILATSTTESGYSDFDSRFLVSCQFDFSIEVPKSDFYTIQIGSGRRGSLNYSLQEMQDMNWEVVLSLS